MESDAQLLRRVVARDPEAPGMLFERFSGSINRVVWKLLGADPEHNDVVHDVFLTVWTEMQRGSVRVPESLEGWVVGVTVHRVRRVIRSRIAHRRMLGAHAGIQPRVAPTSPEASDLLRRVYTLLEQIPPDDRLAFSLRYLDQRTLVETADACGCSLATAKRRIARATELFERLARPFPDIVELLLEDGREHTARKGEQ